MLSVCPRCGHATTLQWGLVLADEDAHQFPNVPDQGIAGFNGASSSRTRMQDITDDHGYRMDELQWGLVLADEDALGSYRRSHPKRRMLQWGLVLADEDAALAVVPRPLRVAASMGPRPRGRGCPDPRRRSARPVPRFNGASSSRTR